MKIKSMVIAGLLAVAGSAFAVVVPQGSPHDARIKTVTWNPRDVTQIAFRVGESFLIQFEADEFLVGEPAGLGMGDAEAWGLAVRGNNLFFKPKTADKPSTNLVVTTNKRRYAFDLKEVKDCTSKCRRNPPEASTYILDFIYPDTIAKAEAEKAEAERLANAIKESKNYKGPRNVMYYMQGDLALAPTTAWDDGRFTHLEWKTSRELPAIFKVTIDGKEALVNRHIDPDTGEVVIHETAKRFILRLGDAVLAIDNERYTPDGAFNNTGTTSDKTFRAIKGAK